MSSCRLRMSANIFTYINDLTVTITAPCSFFHCFHFWGIPFRVDITNLTYNTCCKNKIKHAHIGMKEKISRHSAREMIEYVGKRFITDPITSRPFLWGIRNSLRFAAPIFFFFCWSRETDVMRGSSSKNINSFGHSPLLLEIWKNWTMN